MYLAWMGYLMIAVFMALIMKGKSHAFSALLLVPVAFGIVACLVSGTPVLAMGGYCADGITGMAKTFSLVLFAILYFGTMLSAGLFDPIVDKLVGLMNGDPVRVLVCTSIMAAVVSTDGDATTTTLICCTALLPVYERLGIRKLYLAGTILLQNTVMNLVPWGGPNARVISAMDLSADALFRLLLPGMLAAVVYNIGVARYIGQKERKRLGIQQIDISQLKGQRSEGELAYRRPRLFWFNAILTVCAMVLLVAGWVPGYVSFALATALALAVNYPSPAAQKRIIDQYGAAAVQVLVLILAAGALMGVLNGTGMADAMALHLSGLIPENLSGYYALLMTLIGCAGTFFLSNDAFYFGVLPVLAETGAAFGFTTLEMAFAGILGQAFHLISPLVGFLYLMLKLTETTLGEVQKFVAKWAIGIFVLYVLCGLATGALVVL